MSKGESEPCAHHTRVSRGEWIGLGAILMLALALRTYTLGRDPLWYDEAVYAYLAQHWNPALLLGDGIQVSPLYCGFLAVWQALGSSDTWMRVPSVLFGLGTVALAWALGRRLAGPRAGWTSAAIAACAPFLVFYSRDAKMYALVAFLSLAVAHLTLLYGSSEGRWVHLVLYSLAATALIQAHLVSGFYLAAVNVLFIILYARSLRKTAAWLVAQAAVVLISAPYLWAEYHYAQQMAGRHFWAPPPTPRSLYITACNLIAGYATAPWVNAAALLLVAGLALAGLAAARERRRAMAFMLLLACLQVALVYGYARRAHVSPFVDRYLIASAAPMLVAAAIGMAGLASTRLRVLALAGILALFALSLDDLYGYTFSNNPREHLGVYRTYDAHGMRDLLCREGRPGDVVWHPTWTTLMQLRWYAPQFPHVLVDMAGQARERLNGLAPPSEREILGFQPTELEDALASARRVWLVLEEDLPAVNLSDRGFAAWLEARAALKQRVRFGGRYAASSVYLFDLDEPATRTASTKRLNDTFPAALHGAGSDEVPVVLQPEQGTVSLANATPVPCGLAYEVTASRFAVTAAEFDRALAGESRWQVRPYADSSQSRMAGVARLNRSFRDDDVLTTQLEIPPGAYRVFVERLTTGTQSQHHAAWLELRLDRTSFELRGESHEPTCGWAWQEAGAFQKANTGPCAVVIATCRRTDQPESLAAFSRVVFLNDDHDTRQSPVVATGVLAMAPGQTQVLNLSSISMYRRMDVTVSTGPSSGAVWWIGG